MSDLAKRFEIGRDLEVGRQVRSWKISTRCNRDLLRETPSEVRATAWLRLGIMGDQAEAFWQAVRGNLRQAGCADAL